MFHVNDGLAFERHDNGDVTIHVEGMRLPVTADTWKSVIASMSKGGDLSKLTADLFHDGEPLAPMCESLQKHGRCN